ncbi:MAG TPA: ATP synthase F1 subunit delta [Pleomorphomonadaceae bacterium]|nr:ATP synthase F1 subunit delta [Pleomorphomonadaceae bacterium]
MARRDTAARRYAEAAFQVARESDALDRWQADLAVLDETLAMPELRAVIEHPAVAFADKERILRRAAADVGAEPLNLVLLMIRRGRPGAIPAMRRHFEELVRRQRGIARAEIRSALPLDKEDRAALERTLARLAGQEVELTELVDPSLIGGISVRIGDRLYDASIRSRLERLRARLTAV